MCMCVCVCARARACACMRAFASVRPCVRVRARACSAFLLTTGAPLPAGARLRICVPASACPRELAHPSLSPAGPDSPRSLRREHRRGAPQPAARVRLGQARRRDADSDPVLPLLSPSRSTLKWAVGRDSDGTWRLTVTACHVALTGRAAPWKCGTKATPAPDPRRDRAPSAPMQLERPAT